MRSTAILALLAMLLAAAPAAAQVAAPTLLPGTVRVQDPEQWSDLHVPAFDEGAPSDLTFVPENPAAMQWAKTSEVGLGAVKAGGDLTLGGTSKSYDHSGSFAGFRWTGGIASLGLQALQMHGESTLAAGDKQRILGAAVAVRLGVLAIGASQTKHTQEFDYVPTSVHLQTDRTNRSIGASLRIAEQFYLGAQTGKLTFDFRRTTPPPGISFSMERGLRGVGLGYVGSGPNPWHFEVYRNQKGSAINTTNSVYLPEETTTGGVIEATFGPVLVGLQSLTTNTKRSEPTPYDQKMTSGQLNLAWVSAGGWTVGAHLERTKVADSANTFEHKASATALSVGHRF